MTERELTALVLAACRDRGLLAHHCRDSRHCQGEKGLPDLLVVGRYLLFAELKGESERFSMAQLRWRDYLRRAGVRWMCWRPEDWHCGRVETELDAISGLDSVVV